jgi:hypothetical protein
MKKTFATVALAVVTVFGSTFANAGIIVSDAPAPGGIIVGDGKDGGSPCKEGIIVSDAPGIIVSDIFDTITGIIVGDQKCTEKDGIIVSDAPGIIVGD